MQGADISGSRGQGSGVRFSLPVPCPLSPATFFQRGFTLIEVLVALIILGISLGAVFQALSSSRRISLKADETLEAVRLAGNLLSSSALVDTALKGRGIAARIDGEAGWRYTLSALPLEIDTGNKRDLLQIPAMFELTLCLFHETDRREKAFCMKKWFRQ